MLPNLYPADELARVREQIRRLKLREAELRDGYLQGRLNPVGYEARVDVARQKRRVFLREKLPPALLLDPTFWEDRITSSVVLQRLGPDGRWLRGSGTSPRFSDRK